MSELLQPGNAPFLAAIGVMVAIGLLEALAILLGMGLVSHADHFLATHFPLDPAGSADAGVVGQFLGWLHLGRVPLLMLAVLFLLGFAVGGLLLQALIASLAGRMLPAAAAAAIAMLGALPFVRLAGGVLARYAPRDESSAISELDFVGRMAKINLGEASAGKPAGARLVDAHGQSHYILVEPDDPDQRLTHGQEVLVVARVSSSLYRAIANPRPDLL